MMYVKPILIALIVAGWSWFCFHQGGLSSTGKLEALQAAQAEGVAKAVLAERAQGAAELARVNAVLKEYENAPIDPIAIGLAQRVYQYARVASCPVSKTSTDTPGTVQPSPQPPDPQSVERALDAHIQACSADAAQLNALIEAWPR